MKRVLSILVVLMLVLCVSISAMAESVEEAAGEEVPQEELSEEQLQEAVKAANLADMVSKLPQGLDTMLEEHGANLSGGQRQRIAIARAIIRDPQVILLDEATSALDVISEKEIQEALQRLQKNRTTFIVAHRLSTVKNADRIAVLSAGKIVEEGSYTELMEKKGIFYHMESLQVSLA